MFINIYSIYNTSCKHKPVRDIKTIPRRQHSNPLLPIVLKFHRSGTALIFIVVIRTERKHGKIRVTLRTLTTQSVQYSITCCLKFYPDCICPEERWMYFGQLSKIIIHHRPRSFKMFTFFMTS